MIDNPYPHDFDCLWLATDHDGYVGAFVTAGIAPIPAHLFEAGQIPVEDIGERVSDLPRVSAPELLVSLKRPDDFVDLASRGLFAFDWTDVHRAKRDDVGGYELIAIPSTPTKLETLPKHIADSAACCKLEQLSFRSARTLGIRKYFSCKEGSHR